MDAPVTTNSLSREEKIRQTIKWIVYSLLLLNWSYYIVEDWQVAQHTLFPGDPIHKWLVAYATSLDELAWFALLFLFELETYWLPDDALTRFKRVLFVGIRIVCYAFLINTMFAYWYSYLELVDAVALPAGTSVCDFAGQDYSFTRNLSYVEVTAANCASLSTGGNLFQIGGDPVVTDSAGLADEFGLGIIDIIDVTVWLAVVLLIELTVVIQERGTAEGPLITYANYLTIGLYAILVFDAGYWIWMGHHVYGWDQLLWIGGFVAIEMNLSEWRDEMLEGVVAD